MKLESYQANIVIVNQDTDPKRHGICGNDGYIIFRPPQLRDKFMAEHAALVAVAEAAANAEKDARFAGHSAERRIMDIQPRLAKALASLAAVRAGSEVAK